MRFFIILLLLLIPAILLADSDETNQSHWIEAMDFDGSSPPANWPECNGASWQGWSGKIWDCTPSPGDDVLVTDRTYNSSARALKLSKSATDYETTGIQFDISPAVSKLHIRYYIYFDSSWNACETNNNSDNYIHHIFLNTAVAGDNFGVDIFEFTDNYPYDPICNSDQTTVFAFHSYDAGPSGGQEWGVGPTDVGDCLFIEDSLIGGWHLVEHMFDLDNDLRKTWIDGVLKTSRTVTEFSFSEIDWIFFTFYLDNSQCDDDEVNVWVDNLVLATDYIGAIGGADSKFEQEGVAGFTQSTSPGTTTWEQ